MTGNTLDLNDLITETPSLIRFTEQCNMLERACARKLRLDTQAEFVVFVNKFMDTHEHDELGGWAEIAEMVEDVIR